MKDYLVFSFKENKLLASLLASSLHAKLGRISLTHFSDGEMLVKSAVNVKDKDIIVIASTFKKAHEKLFALLLLLDSLNRAQVKSIQLFIPYFGYSRQERVSWTNEPISCEVVSKILETAQYDKLVSFDLHHPDIEKFFKRGIVNAMTTELFKDYYLNYIREHHLNINDVVVVSPDHGANHRADCLVKELKVHKIILDKVRSRPNQAEHLQLINGDVKGKTCIVIDDIIDTGGTLVSASKLLYKLGAKAVLAGASHAVFSNNCLKKLLRAKINDIVVCNTIEQRPSKYVKVLDISPLILKYID